VSVNIEYSTGIDPATLIELGAGGEGRVYKFTDNPELVYKEYFVRSQTSPNPEALTRLIDLPDSWSVAEQKWFETRTVWPRTAVFDHGRLRGYIMKRIPETCWRLHGIRKKPRSVLCDWNFLSLRNRYRSNTNLISDIPDLGTADITQLVIDLAKTIAFLHEHGVIIGDLSGRNLIWTNQPSLYVMLIDCDGFRIRGASGVNYTKQTPDWIDPEVKGPTNQQSDIYKLSLAAFRAIWGAGTDLPPTGIAGLEAPPHAPAKLPSLIARSSTTSQRPTAAQWVQELTEHRPPVLSPSSSPSTGDRPTRRPKDSPLTQRVRPTISINPERSSGSTGSY
jgi:serine/threonine protein kinase